MAWDKVVTLQRHLKSKQDEFLHLAYIIVNLLTKLKATYSGNYGMIVLIALRRQSVYFSVVSSQGNRTNFPNTLDIR